VAQFAGGVSKLILPSFRNERKALAVINPPVREECNSSPRAFHPRGVPV
jgi:hypothetical protein